MAGSGRLERQREKKPQMNEVWTFAHLFVNNKLPKNFRRYGTFGCLAEIVDKKKRFQQWLFVLIWHNIRVKRLFQMCVYGRCTCTHCMKHGNLLVAQHQYNNPSDSVNRLYFRIITLSHHIKSIARQAQSMSNCLSASEPANELVFTSVTFCTRCTVLYGYYVVWTLWMRCGVEYPPHSAHVSAWCRCVSILFKLYLSHGHWQFIPVNFTIDLEKWCVRSHIMRSAPKFMSLLRC